VGLGGWNPTDIVSSDKLLPTASQVVVVSTDQGAGYLKALSSNTNRHQLAAEWVGTGLSEALSLPTLDAGTIQVPTNKIVLYDGSFAEEGLGFITRQRSHIDWTGAIDELERIPRPHDFATLVLLDTWIRNWDRYPPLSHQRQDAGNEKNVFLGWNDDDKTFELVPMDFGHSIVVDGQIGPTLRSKIEDDRVFGLFPAFRQLLSENLWDVAFQKLQGIQGNQIDGVVTGIPSEWIATPETRDILRNFLHARRDYMLAEKDRIIRYVLNDRLPFSD